MLDILAGMLCGTLVGLVASAHAALIFTFRPPRMLQQRIEEERAATVVTFAALGTVTLSIIAGISGALIADALLPESANFGIVPSSEYLIMVIIVIAIFGVPMLFFLRDRLLHGLFELALALGIYGILLPNAVIALQNRV